MTRCHQKRFYQRLFRTSADAVRKLGSDPRFLGGRMRMVSVLHTWGCNLAFHPHVHSLMPGGGVIVVGAWLRSRGNFLPPMPNQLDRNLLLQLPNDVAMSYIGLVQTMRQTPRMPGRCAA